MRRIMLLVAVLALFSVASGCASYAGTHPVPVGYTEIVLKENDFKTVQTHLKGSADCAYIFNIPLGDTNVLSKALGQIRDSAAMEGKPAMLVNFTKDETIFSILFYKKHKVTLTADMIEYTK